jgi:hypothetical protein
MGSMNVNHRVHSHMHSAHTHHGEGGEKAGAKKGHAAHGKGAQSHVHGTPADSVFQSSPFLPIHAVPAGAYGQQQPQSPQQTELKLVMARFEAEKNPGLRSDTSYLRAAKEDLSAFQRFAPNSPRVAELKSLVKELSHQVTQEAIQQMDQALNTWFQSDGSRADDQKLYQTACDAEHALRASEPGGSAEQFVHALRTYLEGQLFPRPPTVYY